MNNYPIYKDSEIEWLSKVPVNWGLGRLKNSIISCKNGIWGEEKQADENDIDCVRIADFNRTNFEVNDNEFTIRNLDKGKQNQYILKKGDLLIEKSGGGEKQPVGFVAQYNHDKPAIYTNFMAKMVLNPQNANSDYFKYLHSTIYAHRINVRSIKQTTGIQNLDTSYYFEEKVPYPSLEEQRKIGSFLDQKTFEIDDLIADKERLIELLQEKRQILITETVTNGLNHDDNKIKSNVRWIGKMPKGWSLSKIKHVCSIRNEKVMSNDTLPYLGLEHIVSKKGDLLELGETTVEGVSNRFYQGDVLFGKLRPYLAKVFCSDFEGKCTSELLVLKPDENKIDNEYLKYIMLSSHFIEEVNSSTFGAKMPRADWEFISNCYITLPTLDEQVEIKQFLNLEAKKMDSIVRSLDAQINKLKEYRQSLIYEAVTGKIDVSDYPL